MHIFFAFLMLSLCVLVDESTLTTESGESLTGTLESVSQGSIQFKTVSGSASYSYEKVANVVLGDTQSQTDEPAPIEVFLVDESVIRAKSFLTSSGKSQVQTADEISLEFENRNLHSVLFKPQSEFNFQSEWKQIRENRLEAGDAIVVKRSGGMEAIEGIVGDISDKKIEFKLEDRSARIDRSKIIGIIFYHAEGREIPPSNLQLTMGNGSSLKLRQIEFAGESFLATASSGARFDLPRDTVAKLDFSLGRAVFLSTMTPTNRDWTPLIAGSAIKEKLRQVRLPRVNRSFDNRPLELLVYPNETETAKTPRTQKFDNGYAMVGGSKLVFALDRKYERLTGLAGFSPMANSSGDVTLKIRCDSQIVLQQHMRKSDNKNPFKLDIDVNGVQRLVIEVDYHDGRAIGDWIHLCNLEVSR